MHQWSDDDNLIAYCLYRLGNKEETFSIKPQELAVFLGMSYGSLALKVANFKAIDGDGGMAGFSQQAKDIYKQYKNLTDTELREIGIKAVMKALDKYTNR